MTMSCATDSSSSSDHAGAERLSGSVFSECGVGRAWDALDLIQTVVSALGNQTGVSDVKTASRSGDAVDQVRSAATCALSAVRPRGVSEIQVVRRPRWMPLRRLT